MGRSRGNNNNNDTHARSFSQRNKGINMGRSNKGNNNDMTSSTGKKKSTNTSTVEANEVIATRTRGTSSSTSPATRARSASPNAQTPRSKSISSPIPRKAKFSSQQTPTTSAPVSGSKRQREASVEKVRSKNEKAKAPSSSAGEYSGSDFSKKGRREKERRPSPEGGSKSPVKGRELRALLGIPVVSSVKQNRAGSGQFARKAPAADIPKADPPSSSSSETGTNRAGSGQFARKAPAADIPKADPPSSSSSENGTNSENDIAAKRASTKDASKNTEKKKAKFSAASEKPVEEAKESASKSVVMAEKNTEEKKPDAKTDESAAVKETSPSNGSSRTDKGETVKKREAPSKEVPAVEPISVKIPEEASVIQSLKEQKPEEAVAVAETEKKESANKLSAPEQTTDKKPGSEKDSKELTDIEAGPTVDVLSVPLKDDTKQSATVTVEAPIVDGSTVTSQRAIHGSDSTEDVEMAGASAGSTTDRKESAKPVGSSEIDSTDKISKAKRKRSNNEASSENSSADGKDSSENARRSHSSRSPPSAKEDMPASKQKKRQSLADESSNDEMEESVSDNDTGNSNEKKRKRNDHKNDPAYAGVGENRIRITPVPERRFLGSISNQVVERLLSEYALAANTEVWPPIEAPYSEDEEVVEPKKTGDGSSSGASETAIKESGHGADETGDNEILEVPGAPFATKLVHDFSIPNKQAYRSGRPTKNPVDPPILIDSQQPPALAKSLQYLPADYKVNILNRRTGQVLSGAKAVPLNELPALLQKDSSLEPIIPPPGADPEHLESFTRKARSSTRAYVRGAVEPQSRSSAPFLRGEFVVLTKGPQKGIIGTFDRDLPGGWSLVKRQAAIVGPSVVVNPEYLERHRPKANHAAKKRSRKSKPPQFSATLSEEIFMKAVSAFYDDGKAELMLDSTANTELAQNSVMLRKSLAVLEQDEKVAVSYAKLGFAKQNALTLSNSTHVMSKQAIAIKRLKEQKAAKERGGSSATWHPSRMFN